MPAANEAANDIRVRLREDHDQALAELDGLGAEVDTHRCLARLARLRRAWVIHALAEESVVYRTLEGASTQASEARADDRFVEHELVEGLFDKLSRTAPGSAEWHARIHVVRDLVARHIATEYEETFPRLAQRFGAAELEALGERFDLARTKLTLLEDTKDAKAA